MSFDDLLIQLDKALNKPEGITLAQHIRDMFHVALIDEFQDTDAIQYRIFNNLYPVVAKGETTDYGLFLIGDPKQAIYAFRGADIYTYIQAKHQIHDHYTLPTNWRSSASMINATNHLFAQAQSAFIYDDDIPFLPVNASANADQRGLFIDGAAVSALRIWNKCDEHSKIGKGEYEQAMADATADEIHRLLTLAQQGRCQVGSAAGHAPLRPDHIAILVRTGFQAKKIKKALLARNITSVYMSDRSSVFESPEATDIYRLMAACLEPTNERYIRAALATPLLANDAATLDQLNNDEGQWESAIEEFGDYHNEWLRRGILPMLQTLVTRRKLAENLLATPDGERRLTNILHIGELLAKASREKETPQALLRWLQERMLTPDTSAKEQQLHLESERKLVKIVTIHKSKGLEYGVVFIPFVCTWRQATQAIYHDDNQQVVADLLGGENALKLADRERLAEDLRLLYVALTRSVHACYLGLGPVKYGNANQKDKTDLHKTALGYLLAPEQHLSPAEFEQGLQQLANDCSAITICDLPEPALSPYQQETELYTTLEARQFTGNIVNNWWMTSYSALSRHSSHTTQEWIPDASHETAGLDLEVHDQRQAQADELIRPNYSSLLDFPRGAQPGTFLHTIFEHVAFENPDSTAIEQVIRDQLLTMGFDEQWLPVLHNMVNTITNAHLNNEGLTLSALKGDSYKTELEFNLPLGLLKAHELNALLKQYDPLSKQAGDLVFQNVQGMLKGFIDLTFTHDGRWYVLDWKSNWLGNTTAAYTQSAMAEGMIDHRYDLQYLIYILALHRLLKSRLPDYHYETHMGGAFYIFLRGVQDANLVDVHEARTGIYFHRPEQALIEALDRLFQGDSAKETTTC